MIRSTALAFALASTAAVAHSANTISPNLPMFAPNITRQSHGADDYCGQQ